VGELRDPDFMLSAFELAIKIGDPESIKLFLRHNIREKKKKWKAVQPELKNLLTSMPDFTLQCKWDCENSWIPFLSTFMPSRSYWLQKRDDCFRLTADPSGHVFVYNGESLFYLD
jgi:hypothetical protein